MDNLFFIASKGAWFFLRPDTLLVILFALPLVFLRLGRVQAGSRLLALALSITIVIGVLPVDNLVLIPLERLHPANPKIEQPTGIIVLGGAEDVAPRYGGSMAQVNHAADRLIATIYLARQFPEAVVLYSGGSAVFSQVEQKPWQVGPNILRQLGLPEDRLIVEGRSRSTAENAVLSLATAPNEGKGTWVLVTSASHMPRALASFCAAGWRNLIPFPTDYRGKDVIGWRLLRNLEILSIGIKEWVGLLAYRLTGRTEALFPESCG